MSTSAHTHHHTSTLQENLTHPDTKHTHPFTSTQVSCNRCIFQLPRKIDRSIIFDLLRFDQFHCIIFIWVDPHMHTGGVRGGRRGTPHVPPLKNLKMTLHLWVNHSRVSRSPCCVGLYFISQSGLGIHRVIQTTCKFHSRLLGIIFMVNFLYVFFLFSV